MEVQGQSRIWKMGADNYWKLAFTSHQNEENQDVLDALAGHKPYGIKKIWDVIDDFGALETAMYQGKLTEEVIQNVFAAKMKNEDAADLVEDYELSLGSGSIWLMNFKSEEISAKILEAVEIARDGWMGANGDDSFFDYYPDVWHILDQVVPAIAIITEDGGWLSLLEKVRQHVVNMRYDAWNDGYSLIGAGDDHLLIKRKMLYEGYLKEVDMREDGKGRFEYTAMGEEFLKKEGLWVLG